MAFVWPYLTDEQVETLGNVLRPNLKPYDKKNGAYRMLAAALGLHEEIAESIQAPASSI